MIKMPRIRKLIKVLLKLMIKTIQLSYRTALICRIIVDSWLACLLALYLLLALRTFAKQNIR